MKFQPCEIPVLESDYEELYRAVLKEHAEGRAIRVALEGKHHGSVLAALRKRHTDKTTRIASTRDADNDALVVYVAQEMA